MDYLNSKISEARMLRCEEAGYIRGVREGTAKGREEGREEERLVIAKSMLSTGAEVGYVVTVTGLSEEQVKSLK